MHVCQGSTNQPQQTPTDVTQPTLQPTAAAPLPLGLPELEDYELFESGFWREVRDHTQGDALELGEWSGARWGLAGVMVVEDSREGEGEIELGAECFRVLGFILRVCSLHRSTFKPPPTSIQPPCNTQSKRPDDLPEGSSLEMVYLLGKLREEGGPLDWKAAGRAAQKGPRKDVRWVWCVLRVQCCWISLR
jgi:hypothetical protein